MQRLQRRDAPYSRSLPHPHQLHLEGDDDDANYDGHGQGPPHPEMSPHHLHLRPDFHQRASTIPNFSLFFLFCIFAILRCLNVYLPQ